MKKRTLVNLVLFTLLISAFHLQAQITSNNGRDKVVLSNWVNPMDSQVVDFQHDMTIQLFLGSLLYVHLKTNIAPVATVSNFPDIYIQYEFGSYTGTIGPLVDADFVPITFENDEPGLQASFLNTFDFTNECANDAGKDGIFQLPVSFSLMTFSSGDYSLYPVLDHPQLFPPEWFEQTSQPYPLPTYSATKNMDCLWLSNTHRSDEGTVDTPLLTTTAIQPNPFTNDLEVAYQLDQATTLDINVLGAYGQIVYQHRTLRKDAGKHLELLPLEHLPPGLYYLQARTEQGAQVTKVLKH